MTDIKQTVQQLERILQEIEQAKNNNPQQITAAVQEARQHLEQLKRQQS